MANLSLEFILNDFSARQQRANNIFISNLPEQKKKTTLTLMMFLQLLDYLMFLI